MIQDRLIPALAEKYGASAFKTCEPPHPIVVFPARHEKVGDLSIWENDNELTVGIGDITHGHFAADGVNLSQEEIEKQIVGQVMQFLDALFTRRLHLWKSKNGGSGGWGPVENLKKPPFMPSHNLYFHWSGPIRRPFAVRLAAFLHRHFPMRQRK